jgi:N-acetylglucosamine-6-phosphate deacetylase
MAKTNDRFLAGPIARAGTVEEGWIKVEGGLIAAAGGGRPPRPPDERHEGILAPGYCDLQVNGAGSHEVTDGGAALDAIDAIQIEHGVTAYLPTIVSTDDATVERSVAELERRVADPSSPVFGVHLEGPFLSPNHAGAHRIDSLRTPAQGVPSYFSSPAIRLVTISPELPGALELIAELSARGVAVSLGHSGADADCVKRALDAGAEFVTHVFNAMAPFHHRDPGLVGVALTDPHVFIGVIADGLHVDPIALELVRRAVGDRVVLVSDSTPMAAAVPGRYTMGGVEVEATDTGVRTESGRLAGSALTLDLAVRNWCSMTGASLAHAIRAASEAPARVVGRQNDLRPGCQADIVLLDDRGGVQRVMRFGRWMHSRSSY